MLVQAVRAREWHAKETSGRPAWKRSEMGEQGPEQQRMRGEVAAGCTGEGGAREHQMEWGENLHST